MHCVECLNNAQMYMFFIENSREDVNWHQNSKTSIGLHSQFFFNSVPEIVTSQLCLPATYWVG